MSITDPIADALTKIRNAYRAGHKEVIINHNNIIENIIRVMSDENFINGFEITEITTDKRRRPLVAASTKVAGTKSGIRKGISISLRYTNDGRSVIRGLERVSTPGRRVYVKADNVPRVLNNIGCAIISTNTGVIVDRVAREKRVGGEYICKVW